LEAGSRAAAFCHIIKGLFFGLLKPELLAKLTPICEP
jgi:hypothetical protein